MSKQKQVRAEKGAQQRILEPLPPPQVMPSLRSPIPATRHVKHLRLQGRIYSTIAGKSLYVPIETQEVDSRRFPLIEGAFTDFDIQHHIHDTAVIVRDGRHTYKFHLFVKNHCRMNLNAAVAALGGNWRGDIIVMRAAIAGNFVVNMRGGDGRLADFVVKKFVKKVRQKTPFILPKSLLFTA